MLTKVLLYTRTHTACLINYSQRRWVQRHAYRVVCLAVKCAAARVNEDWFRYRLCALKPTHIPVKHECERRGNQNKRMINYQYEDKLSSMWWGRMVAYRRRRRWGSIINAKHELNYTHTKFWNGLVDFIITLIDQCPDHTRLTVQTMNEVIPLVHKRETMSMCPRNVMMRVRVMKYSKHTHGQSLVTHTTCQVLIFKLCGPGRTVHVLIH